MALVLIYVAMLIFDAAAVAAGYYVFVERGQSGWWMVLALVLVAGSNPGPLLRHWRGK